MIHQQELAVATSGRTAHEVTRDVAEIVRASGVRSGLAHVFILHTSASLTITENADPDVCRDLETVFTRLAPDGDAAYRHRSEGDDDMASHVRSVLTQTALTVPVSDGGLVLGTWQGLFVWEHRYRGYRRRLMVTVMGTAG